MLWYLDTHSVHRPDAELGTFREVHYFLYSAFHIVTQQYGAVGHRRTPSCTICASYPVHNNSNMTPSMEMERTLYRILVIILIFFLNRKI